MSSAAVHRAAGGIKSQRGVSDRRRFSRIESDGASMARQGAEKRRRLYSPGGGGALEERIESRAFLVGKPLSALQKLLVQEGK